MEFVFLFLVLVFERKIFFRKRRNIFALLKSEFNAFILELYKPNAPNDQINYFTPKLVNERAKIRIQN